MLCWDDKKGKVQALLRSEAGKVPGERRRSHSRHAGHLRLAACLKPTGHIRVQSGAPFPTLQGCWQDLWACSGCCSPAPSPLSLLPKCTHLGLLSQLGLRGTSRSSLPRVPGCPRACGPALLLPRRFAGHLLCVRKPRRGWQLSPQPLCPASVAPQPLFSCPLASQCPWPRASPGGAWRV